MSVKSKNRDYYYDRASSWDQEIVAGALKSRKTAWIIASVSLGLAALSLLCLLLLLPLKTFEPYVISVDRHTGYMEVTKGLSKGLLSQDQAITEANLVRYVSLREQYNPAILKDNYETVALMSGGPALKEHQELWSAQNPDNPSIKLGGNAHIDIKIKSVSFLNENTASVRFLKEISENERQKTSHWNAIIGFQYTQKPVRMRERFSNPLGFQVTSYRINPETLEKVR